jgi:outer membrane protease
MGNISKKNRRRRKTDNCWLQNYKYHSFRVSYLLEVSRLVHSGRDDLHYLRKVKRTDTENTEKTSALFVVGQRTQDHGRRQREGGQVRHVFQNFWK